MTETTSQTEIDAETEQPTNQSADTNTERTGDRSNSGSAVVGDPSAAEIWRYLGWAALGLCSVLALFALVQFYASTTDVIDLWVEPRHQPLMHAAFNLLVLLGSLIGISLLVRELHRV
ncbi:hypothetical protein CV102_13800 [Natronococcus pandeyae]|uniref:DUF8060 domain-containing protein n=1 Tax=Natronococcus pandeyae TaxID=2055836 RepID=A0A8J8Q3N8_9EURY|nr:hypothetical protein [Natronococcus pandeyae]TYL38262.1 hypothetical protein CV102_13800 [Natronococcus pandeyae]